ncbi:uncharacterized protein LOC129251241 [Anastrepha obliqua]|uniref:uncharacterized protein LOC129251241 n=1 Tax=Anastrepha obliqua TaxID=95512 RepID=UPI00240950BD|nr:uncharacterized protein LOC129251241 [Anastrepha obliqua]
MEEERKRVEKHLVHTNYPLEVSDTEDAEKDISAGEENAAKDMNEGEDTDGGNINLLPKKANRGKINFIDDRMLACMDKWNLSTRDAMHLVSATVAAFINTMQSVNGTPSIKMEDLILNRTTLHSMRRDFRRRQAQEIINGFNIPDVFVLHWDGKLLAEIRGTEKKDRLSLVVTGENMGKLLGIPKIESSTGDAIAAEIHNFLCK